VTGIPASTSVFPSQYQSTNAAYFIFIVNSNRDKRTKPGNLKTKICCGRCWRTPRKQSRQCKRKVTLWLFA